MKPYRLAVSWLVRALEWGRRGSMGWQTVDEQDCRSAQQPQSRTPDAPVAGTVSRADPLTESIGGTLGALRPGYHRSTSSALEHYWA